MPSATEKVVFIRASSSYDTVAEQSLFSRADEMIVGHYGFTEKELYFILNDDIEYRMGRSDGDEE